MVGTYHSKHHDDASHLSPSCLSLRAGFNYSAVHIRGGIPWSWSFMRWAYFFKPRIDLESKNLSKSTNVDYRTIHRLSQHNIRPTDNPDHTPSPPRASAFQQATTADTVGHLFLEVRSRSRYHNELTFCVKSSFTKSHSTTSKSAHDYRVLNPTPVSKLV